MYECFRAGFLLTVFFVVFSLPLLADDDATIALGMSVSLSGKWSRPGQEQLNGIQLWVEDVNRRGGLLKRHVELVFYDDESNPDLAAEHYETLVQIDKVDLLLGPYSSTITLRASEVAEKHRYPMLSAGASSTSIWARGYRHIFGLYAPSPKYVDQILGFAKQRQLQSLALAYESEEFPTNIAASVKREANDHGIKVVFEKKYFKSTEEFSPVVAHMLEHDPDIIILGSYLPGSIDFMREAKRQRLSADIFALVVGPSFPDFGVYLGEIAEGVMGNSQWEAVLPIPGAKDFAARYQVQFGYEPGYHAAGGYAACQVLEQAVTLQGTLNREELRTTLSDLDTETIFGRYKVDENGMQVGKPVYVIQWLDGRREIVFPEEYATRNPKFPFPPWDNR